MIELYAQIYFPTTGSIALLTTNKMQLSYFIIFLNNIISWKIINFLVYDLLLTVLLFNKNILRSLCVKYFLLIFFRILLCVNYT